jgi:hypothetical protein
MRLKARLNFAEPWSGIIPEVAKQCGMTVDQYCERAVMLVTKQGLEGGEQHNDGGTTDTPILSQQALSRTDDSSTALADSEIPNTTPD